MAGALPVLWLYGPPGVGKSTVGWELFARLAGDEVPLAYVDIDQLGMFYGPPTPEHWSPEPASDPGRYYLKTLNLDAVAANARAAGAAGLIVSGVVDPEHGIDTALLPNVALTAIRLRADAEVLRHRLGVRGRPNESIDEQVRLAETLDRHGFPDVCIDTTDLGVDDVLDAIEKHAEGWLTVRATSVLPDRNTALNTAATVPSCPVVLLCGPRPVGLSAVGYEVHRQLRLAGSRTAYLDLEQVGFLRPAPAADPANHGFKAANLAAIRRTYQAGAAACVVAVGTAESAEDEAVYAAALPGVPLEISRASLHPDGRPIEELGREILAGL